MDDFEEKLNSILASPETMGQIMALADSITSQSEETPAESSPGPVSAPAPAANGVQIDRKRLARLRQKRVALGHKPDDHELEQQQGFSMKFHM